MKSLADIILGHDFISHSSSRHLSHWNPSSNTHLAPQSPNHRLNDTSIEEIPNSHIRDKRLPKHYFPSRCHIPLQRQPISLRSMFPIQPSQHAIIHHHRHDLEPMGRYDDEQKQRRLSLHLIPFRNLHRSTSNTLHHQAEAQSPVRRYGKGVPQTTPINRP